MGDDSVVQIHLRRADDLARCLDEAAGAYDRLAPRLDSLLDGARAPRDATARLRAVASALAAESRALHQVVADVRAMESGDADPAAFTARISHEPYDSPFASDDDARRAAADARDAFRRGDRETFTRINELWATEQAYAAELAQQLSPDDVLDALERYDRARTHPFSIDARHEVAAFGNLLQTLSVASRLHVTAPTFGDIADALDRAQADHDGSPSRDNALSYLFEPDVQWSATFLIEAGRRFLIPANRDVLDRGDLGQYALRDGKDARVLVLDRIAGNGTASAALLHDELDDLLPSRLHYRDGGAAVGRVLIAGTAPQVLTGFQRAQDVIDWVATHRDLQPLAQEALAKVATPYLGSFRGLQHKGGPVDDPLPTLDPKHARAFLDHAAETLRGRDDLQDAVVRWADRELRAPASVGYDPRALQVIGNVVGTVAAARYHGGLALAMGVDQQIQDEKRMLNAYVTVLSDLLPFAAGSAATFTAGAVIDGAYPRGQLATEVGRGATRQDALQRKLLETLAVQHLWQARDTNHVDLSPPASLLTADGRLKTYPELGDDDERLAMRRWLDELDQRRVGAINSLDHGFTDAGLGG